MHPDVQHSRLYRESDKWFEHLRDRRRAFMRRCSVAMGSLATGLYVMPNSFLSKNTTVNDKSTAGHFDPKVFVNCVQDKE